MSVLDLFSPDFNYILISNDYTSISEFNCLVRANVNTEDKFKVWLKYFEQKTNTSWNLRQSKLNGRNAFSRDFLCHHSSHRKRKADGKDKKCDASISVRIKYNTKNTRFRDTFVKQGFQATIKMNFKHSHPTDVPEAWKWLQRTEETKSLFIKYFNDGMLPAEAKKYHESLLIMEDPNKMFNSQRNPPIAWVYRLHDNWIKGNFKALIMDPNSCLEKRMNLLHDENDFTTDSKCSKEKEEINLKKEIDEVDNLKQNQQTQNHSVSSISKCGDASSVDIFSDNLHLVCQENNSSKRQFQCMDKEEKYLDVKMQNIALQEISDQKLSLHQSSTSQFVHEIKSEPSSY